MKTNVTCSLETRLVEALDAWRAPMRVSRSGALELLIESIAEGAGAEVTATTGVYFDSNGAVADPGIHHDNPKFDMAVPAKASDATLGPGEYLVREPIEISDTEPPTGDTSLAEESREGPGPAAREVDEVEGPSSIGSSRKPAKPSRR